MWFFCETERGHGDNCWSLHGWHWRFGLRLAEWANKLSLWAHQGTREKPTGGGKGQKRRMSKNLGPIMVIVKKKKKDRWGEYSSWHSAIQPIMRTVQVVQRGSLVSSLAYPMCKVVGSGYQEGHITDSMASLMILQHIWVVTLDENIILIYKYYI